MKLALIRFLGVFVALVASFGAFAAEVIPPAPTQYFNDYAHVVSPSTAAELNRQLEQFERNTSRQILVLVYPKMESGSSIEDYTVRDAQSGRGWQKNRKSGVVLFVFVEDRKMYIQVAYGPEKALPDALAKQIIENEIKPHFGNGDFDGGLRAGVAAILAATKGEYKGTGQTVAERSPSNQSGESDWVIGLVIAFIVIVLLGWLLSYGAGGTVYSSSRRTVSYGGLDGIRAGGGGGFSSGRGGGGPSGGGAVGSWCSGMKTQHLFRELHHDRITAAIAEAEKHTTGEIRVYLSRRKVHDPRYAAAHQFVKLGLDKTKYRNAVLIFIAPQSQNFAVIGDEVVHAKCGEAFWENVVGAIGDDFGQGKFTEGVVYGISTAGRQLAEYFPAPAARHDGAC